jgi:hypothetical protein
MDYRPWAATLGRSICCVSACMLSLAVGNAAEPPKANTYAVMSLIGNELSIVTHQITTGTSLDRNLRTQVPIKNDHFDRVALLTAGKAIDSTTTGTQAQLLLVSDASVYERANVPLSANDNVETLLKPISTQVNNGHPQYLVLITKYRGDTRIGLADGSVGNGKLNGLGFYLDHETRLMKTNDGDSGQGFVAPYAYLTVSLIDLATTTVVRTESVSASTVASVTSKTETDPWGLLTADQKVDMIDRLIRRTLEDVVPRLLKAT